MSIKSKVLLQVTKEYSKRVFYYTYFKMVTLTKDLNKSTVFTILTLYNVYELFYSSQSEKVMGVN